MDQGPGDAGYAEDVPAFEQTFVRGGEPGRGDFHQRGKWHGEPLVLLRPLGRSDCHVGMARRPGGDIAPSQMSRFCVLRAAAIDS